jgi:hypothetical protein
MAIQISKASLTRAHERATSLQNRLSKVRKQAEHTVEKVLRTAETGGMAFGLGFVNGRYGSTEVMGMPIELLIGASLNVAGYLGLAGKHSDHLNNLGDGALAAYGTVLGVQVGTQMKQKAQGQLAPGKTGGSGLTADEIREAVEAQR